MPFCCDRCHKQFKDNYALKRHDARKTPCVVAPPNPPDPSGNLTVNITNILNINVLSNETFPHDLTEHLVNYMRDTLKQGDDSFDYLRAMKWITELHKQICKDNQNLNVKLPSIKSMTAQILTPHGWVTHHTDAVIDEVVKVRSGQLMDLRESIDRFNPRVLQAPTIKRTMRHVEHFSDQGFDHTGVGDHTRLARGSLKVALLAPTK
jgi:hypothetical protein